MELNWWLASLVQILCALVVVLCVLVSIHICILKLRIQKMKEFLRIQRIIRKETIERD